MHVRAILLVCLFAAIPAQAEAEPDAQDQGSEPCELVDWWTSNPGQITIDPDQCYIPDELRPIISRLPIVT